MIKGLIPEKKESRFFYGYVVVIVSCFIMLVMFGTMYSFGVFFKPVLTEFGWSRAETSGAYSMAFFMIGLMGILMGNLNDRFGPRPVVVAGGVLLGAGLILMSQINAVWQFYALYGVVISTGLSSATVPLVATAARWFVKRRGLMTGIVVAGVGTGTVIMPPVADFLITRFGWRNCYVLIGIFAFITIVTVAQFLRLTPTEMGLKPYGTGEVKPRGLSLNIRGLSLREAMHTPQFWILGAVMFCFSFCLEIIIVHIVVHAQGFQIPPAQAATIIAAVGGTSVLGRLALGVVIDRIGCRPTIILCFSLLTVAFIILLFTQVIGMFYLFAFIFGLAYGGLASSQSPMVAELFGLSSHGVIFGAISFVSQCGAAVGPVLAGRIYDVNANYQLAFQICLGIAVLGLLLIIILKPTALKEGKGK